MISCPTEQGGLVPLRFFIGILAWAHPHTSRGPAVWGHNLAPTNTQNPGVKRTSYKGAMHGGVMVVVNRILYGHTQPVSVFKDMGFKSLHDI